MLLPEEGLRPKPQDSRWTWAKIAIVAITLALMALLLLIDLEK